MPEQEKPQVLVSSDAVGVFGSLQSLLEIYRLCLPILQVEQLPIELLSWQVVMSDARTVNKQQLPVQVQAIHGPMISPQGSPTLVEAAKAIVISQVMSEIATAIEGFPAYIAENNQAHYFLLHEPDLRDESVQASLKQLPPGTSILVENVLEKGSLQKTIARAQALKEQGFNAGIMLDLVHLIKEITGATKTLHTLSQAQFDQVWKIVITQVGKTMTLLPGSGLHIPIGVNGDSLPLELMSAVHWQELGQAIKAAGKNIKWLTIENQQHNIIRIRHEAIAPLAVRNQRVLSTLAEHGVI